MRKNYLILAGLIVLTMASCKKESAKVDRSNDPNLAAIVGSKVITKAEYEANVERSMKRYRNMGRSASPNIESRLQENILRRMVENLLFQEKAEKMGIKVTDEAINERFEKQKGNFSSEKDFETYLARTGLTVDFLKKDIAASLLREEVVKKLSGEIKITDEEVKNYFDANSDRFIEPEQVHARHILVRIDRQKFLNKEAIKDADKAQKEKLEKEAEAKAEAEAMEKIKKIKEKLNKKDADFAKIATEFSEGPTAPKGGDLGFFSKKRMVKEFSEVAFAQKDGEISDVVKTRYGLHIIQTVEHKAATRKNFEDEKEGIRTSLENRKKSENRRNVMRALKEEIKPQILIKFEKSNVPDPFQDRERMKELIEKRREKMNQRNKHREHATN